MNIIETLQALDEGKKVRLYEMPKGNYLYKKDDKIMCYVGECNASVEFWLTYSRLFRKDIAELYEEPKSILDTEEKAYLEAVLRPFKDRVKYVYKKNETYVIRESIRFVCDNTDFAESDECIYDLPYFEAGTMYKGMEENKMYKLKDLGLFDRKIY